MKTFRALFAVLALLGASVVGSATTITIVGNYYPGGNPSNPGEPFSITLEYDSNYTPIYVPAGTPVTVETYVDEPILFRNYYLFPVEGITGFSASYDGSPVATSGTWTGSSWPGGAASYLWFDGDIRTPGTYVHNVYANFSSANVSISFGSFMGATDGVYLLDDVFLRGSSGSGFSPGEYGVTVTGVPATPDSSSGLALVSLALAGLVFARRFSSAAPAR